MGRKAASYVSAFGAHNSLSVAKACRSMNERGVVPTVAANEKYKRAMDRLHDGQILYQLKNGQWWFRGNKFLPKSVAQRLPLEKSHGTNAGGVAYRLSDNCPCEICSTFELT